MASSEIMARVSTAKVVCGKAVGITTFIKQSLRGGGGYYDTGDPIGSSGRRSQKRGLQIGRSIDTLFQVHARDRGKRGPRRIRAIFAALNTLDVDVVSTQATVVDKRVGGEHGIKTRLDGLGYIESSRTWVAIELKTTQRTHASHVGTYKTACRRHPKMLNGLPNSEFTAHQIQAGFGARAFAHMYKPGTPVSAVVIVSCADGKAAFYHVSPEHMHDTVYALPWSRPQLLPKTKKQTALVAVSKTDARLRAALAAFGAVKSVRATADSMVCTVTLKTGKAIVCGVLASSSRWAHAQGAARLGRTGKHLPGVRRVLFGTARGKLRPTEV